jgi:phage-related protein
LDPFVYGFHLVVDDDPPIETFEVPGPALDVDPARETGLAPESLLELPYAPSLPITLEIKPEVRQIEFPSGYRVSSARFLKMRRQTTLRWVGLTVDECDAMAAFFQTLMASYGGAFRWRVPGDLEDTVWTCDPYTWRRDGSNAIEVAVIELVFVTELPA